MNTYFQARPQSCLLSKLLDQEADYRDASLVAIHARIIGWEDLGEICAKNTDTIQLLVLQLD
jgi:hypothetical protein